MTTPKSQHLKPTEVCHSFMIHQSNKKVALSGTLPAAVPELKDSMEHPKPGIKFSSPEGTHNTSNSLVRTSYLAPFNQKEDVKVYRKHKARSWKYCESTNAITEYLRYIKSMLGIIKLASKSSLPAFSVF